MAKLYSKAYWFLRHGETDWNARHLSQGRTDIPLNETGLMQARSAGHQLAHLFQDGKRPFTHIVASPLQRAFVTAEYVRDAVRSKAGVELPLVQNSLLQEVCFGIQEGQPMGTWYNPWISGEFVPEGAETFIELQQRAIEAVNQSHDCYEGTPLIVAHGALFRALRAAMGLEVNVRLANAIPLHVCPSEYGWDLHISSEEEV